MVIHSDVGRVQVPRTFCFHPRPAEKGEVIATDRGRGQGRGLLYTGELRVAHRD